ncbi:MAG: hypothetical protein ACR2MX_01985 [Cyclobacteriaceae bacterium]
MKKALIVMIAFGWGISYSFTQDTSVVNQRGNNNITTVDQIRVNNDGSIIQPGKRLPR